MAPKTAADGEEAMKKAASEKAAQAEAEEVKKEKAAQAEAEEAKKEKAVKAEAEEAKKEKAAKAEAEEAMKKAVKAEVDKRIEAAAKAVQQSIFSPWPPTSWPTPATPPPPPPPPPKEEEQSMPSSSSQPVKIAPGLRKMVDVVFRRIKGEEEAQETLKEKDEVKEKEKKGGKVGKGKGESAKGTNRASRSKQVYKDLKEGERWADLKERLKDCSHGVWWCMVVLWTTWNHYKIECSKMLQDGPLYEMEMIWKIQCFILMVCPEKPVVCHFIADFGQEQRQQIAALEEVSMGLFEENEDLQKELDLADRELLKLKGDKRKLRWDNENAKDTLLEEQIERRRNDRAAQRRKYSWDEGVSSRKKDEKGHGVGMLLALLIVS